jgi:peptide/nickel transport system ATP-binding protein
VSSVSELTAETPVLEIENLRVTYGSAGGTVLATDDVSLAARAGERIGIIGETGSGKSTLVRAIVGLLGQNAAISSGEILFRGDRVYGGPTTTDTRAKLRGTSVGMVFQDASGTLNPVMRAGRQLSEIVRAHRAERGKQARQLIQETLESLQFDDPIRVMRAYPFQLSGGMCQRVAIAAAILPEPDVVIADECTSALDVTTQAQVVGILREATVSRNMTLLFVTHDILLASELCTRLVVMYAGQIVEDGDAQELVLAPKHWYTKSLIDSVPLWRAERRSTAELAAAAYVPEQHEGCRFASRCSACVPECVRTRVGWTVDSDGHAYRCIRPLKYSTGRLSARAPAK